MEADTYRMVADRAASDTIDMQPRCEAMCGLFGGGKCGGRLEWHHRCLRSQGGDNTPANGLYICSTCHKWIHQHPTQAKHNGWIINNRQPPHDMGVYRRGTFVYLDNKGYFHA